MEHDEVSHGEIGARTLVRVDERATDIRASHKALAVLVEIAHQLVQLARRLLVVELHGVAANVVIQLLVEVAHEDVPASNSHIGNTLARVLVDFLPLGVEAVHEFALHVILESVEII